MTNNTIKSLTKANAAKYGFEVREDLDFNDDGNHFRGFAYKGLQITQCRSQGETYLAIRVDYLNSENSFTYEEWRNTEECRLANEFNGCSEVNVEKLVENCERIIAKINELNNQVKDEVIDVSELSCKAIDEIFYAQSVVDDFKANYKWYERNEYEVKRLSRYLKSMIDEIDRAKAKVNTMTSLSRKEKKELVERFKNYEYVVIKADDFYLKEMKEALQ